MARLVGRDEVLRRKKRLESVITEVAGATLSPELIAHYSRYLCVLVSGYAEQSIKELVTQYVRLRSEERIHRYVGGQLKRLRNIDTEKLRQLIESFDPLWWQELSTNRQDELAASDSVATIRNSVSHGGDSGITLMTVRQYFDQISLVLGDLCERLDPKSEI
ncbi:HEPN domain-containing protein [Rhodococcus jostii]|uniref:HEPN domain-containing protein n=1 Tax=Rhodococcus jostii TaxID=132919 RepID=UPI00362A2B15